MRRPYGRGTSARPYGRGTSARPYGRGTSALAAANGNPRGITWDGTYLRVLDRDDDKVYTYDASGMYMGS